MRRRLCNSEHHHPNIRVSQIVFGGYTVSATRTGSARTTGGSTDRTFYWDCVGNGFNLAEHCGSGLKGDLRVSDIECATRIRWNDRVERSLRFRRGDTEGASTR